MCRHFSMDHLWAKQSPSFKIHPIRNMFAINQRVLYYEGITEDTLDGKPELAFTINLESISIAFLNLYSIPSIMLLFSYN